MFLVPYFNGHYLNSYITVLACFSGMKKWAYSLAGFNKYGKIKVLSLFPSDALFHLYYLYKLGFIFAPTVILAQPFGLFLIVVVYQQIYGKKNVWRYQNNCVNYLDIS